jgi:hypothetical protein
MTITHIELNEYVLIYDDQGDQEGRLTSIDNPILMKRKEGQSILELEREMNESSAPHISMRSAKDVIAIDKIITISNQFYDEDNLKREEMIDGKDYNDIIHGFKFNDSGTMDKLGYTIVIMRLSEDNNFEKEEDLVLFTRDTYENTLNKLRRIKLNPVGKLNNMYWDTSKIPDEDGNIALLLRHLLNDPEFFQIRYTMLYDFLNGEYIVLNDDSERNYTINSFGETEDIDEEAEDIDFEEDELDNGFDDEEEPDLTGRYQIKIDVDANEELIGSIGNMIYEYLNDTGHKVHSVETELTWEKKKEEE